MSETLFAAGQEVPLKRCRYKGPFKSAVKTAGHFGFTTIKPIPIERKKADEFPVPKRLVRTHYVPPAERAAARRFFFEKQATEIECSEEEEKRCIKPVYVAYTRGSRRKVGYLTLHVAGCENAVAEALLIKTTCSILKKTRKEDLLIHINSLGGESARRKFLDAYNQFLRDNLSSLSSRAQDVARTNSLYVRFIDPDGFRLLSVDIPTTVSFLSKRDRQYFKHLVEYIEALNTPYRINNNLIGIDEKQTSTVFQIEAIKRNRSGQITERKIVARGERYEDLGEYEDDEEERRITTGICATVDLEGGSYESYKDHEEEPRPSLYFMHLGYEAKRVSLSVLDMLHEMNIPIAHSLTENTLAQQIKYARQIGVPIALILGHKEAQEGTIIIRDMQMQSQEVIPLQELPRHLKKRL